MVIRNKKVHKVWVFESGYETVQHCDGSTSCNCVPWKRRGTCRHTRMIELDTIDFNAVNSTEYDPLTPIDMDAVIDMRGLPRGAPSPSRAVNVLPDTSNDPRPAMVSRRFNFNLA